MSLTITRITLAVFALCGLAAAGASPAQVSRTVRVTDSGLDERLDIALKDADVREVLASFGEIYAGEADIDPEVQGEITLEIHNVRAATVLTAVCESVGCRWWIEDGRLRIEKDPYAAPGRGGGPGRAEGPSAERLDAPIDMSLKDADLGQVLQAFGSIVQARIEIEESLDGKVTVELHNTPVRQALDAVCRIHGCTWELEETDEGPVLRFSRR